VFVLLTVVVLEGSLAIVEIVVSGPPRPPTVITLTTVLFCEIVFAVVGVLATVAVFVAVLVVLVRFVLWTDGTITEPLTLMVVAAAEIANASNESPNRVIFMVSQIQL
jgi:hypothetical protein